MRGRDDDVLRAVREEGVGGGADRATGVDHVVDEDADPALHVTDDLVDGDLVGDVLVAALVHDRQRGVQAVAPAVGDAHPAGCPGRRR